MSEHQKDSALVTWSPPEQDGGSEVTHYVLEMKVNKDNWKVKAENVKGTELRVADLKEGVSYEFRVSAVNKVGKGLPSEPSSPVKYSESPDYLSVYWLISKIFRINFINL